jgi:GT2 family glycosyltransferase
VVSVSLVLYNNDLDEVQGVLKCFLTSSNITKVIVIDNSKEDRVSEFLNDDRIVFIHNPSNPGFGASHNLAIELSLRENFDFHIISNVDINFDDGTIEDILKFVLTDSSIGLLMPKIVSPNGIVQNLCKQNPKVFDLFIRGFFPNYFKKYFEYRLANYEMKSYDYSELIWDVPYFSGCFMFFRNSAFRDIGLFDEKFFLYLEDADITRRVLTKYRTVYFPTAQVIHVHNGLTHKKWKYKWITIQSAFIYYSKWGWCKNLF